jgi:hypothetical protein
MPGNQTAEQVNAQKHAEINAEKKTAEQGNAKTHAEVVARHGFVW